MSVIAVKVTQLVEMQRGTQMIPENTTCGCGRPVRYEVADGQLACNKVSRCLTYEELREGLIAANVKLLKAGLLSESNDVMWRSLTEEEFLAGLTEANKCLAAAGPPDASEPALHQHLVLELAKLSARVAILETHKAKATQMCGRCGQVGGVCGCELLPADRS